MTEEAMKKSVIAVLSNYKIKPKFGKEISNNFLAAMSCEAMYEEDIPKNCYNAIMDLVRVSGGDIDRKSRKTIMDILKIWDVAQYEEYSHLAMEKAEEIENIIIMYKNNDDRMSFRANINDLITETLFGIAKIENNDKERDLTELKDSLSRLQDKIISVTDEKSKIANKCALEIVKNLQSVRRNIVNGIDEYTDDITAIDETVNLWIKSVSGDKIKKPAVIELNDNFKDFIAYDNCKLYSDKVIKAIDKKNLAQNKAKEEIMNTLDEINSKAKAMKKQYKNGEISMDNFSRNLEVLAKEKQKAEQRLNIYDNNNVLKMVTYFADGIKDILERLEIYGIDYSSRMNVIGEVDLAFLLELGTSFDPLKQQENANNINRLQAMMVSIKEKMTKLLVTNSKISIALQSDMQKASNFMQDFYDQEVKNTLSDNTFIFEERNPEKEEKLREQLKSFGMDMDDEDEDTDDIHEEEILSRNYNI